MTYWLAIAENVVIHNIDNRSVMFKCPSEPPWIKANTYSSNTYKKIGIINVIIALIFLL